MAVSRLLLSVLSLSLSVSGYKTERDSGYGAPAGGSLSGYSSRRRNARDLDVSDADQILAEEYDY